MDALQQEFAQRRQRGMALGRAGNSRNLPVCRLRVLSSFNLDLIPPFLQEALDRRELFGDVTVAPFGQIASEVFDETSGLYTAPPDAVVLVPAAEDLLSQLFQRPAAFSAAAIEELVTERVSELRACVETLLARLPSVSVFVVSFGASRVPGSHILQATAAERGEAALELFARGLKGLEALSPSVVTMDWERTAARSGRSALEDPRLWYLARMRLNPSGVGLLADQLGGYLAAVRRPARKVIALDLDNTLWGGVVGEQGIDALTLGNEGVGLAFQDFQRELLSWRDAGVLLVVCSKNNPEDALAVFREHPGMVLKEEHLAGWRINWQDKATNLRELAAELDLNLDSFVFLDDNPVERAWVSRELPAVLVPELPSDPVARPDFLRGAEYVQRLVITETDRKRTASYQAARERSQFRASNASFDDFLASLEQEIRLEPLTRWSLSRAAQMCQRTNQFNLTSKRYTPADLEAMLADEGAEVFTVSVKDRFEDSGLTGLAVLRYRGAEAELDTFLLSCRVLGRKVEDQMLALLVEHLRGRQAGRLVGRYVPSGKNGQMEGFLSARGFLPRGDGSFALELGPVPA